MTFSRIETMQQLDALDADLMIDGYWAGFKNVPDYTQRDQAYWHGFLNGQVDGKHAPISCEQAQLASVYVDAMRKARAH